jgi:hypothetical protein
LLEKLLIKKNSNAWSGGVVSGNRKWTIRPTALLVGSPFPRRTNMALGVAIWFY